MNECLKQKLDELLKVPNFKAHTHFHFFFRISLYSLQEMHNLSNAAANLPRLQNANSFFITVFCDLESRPDSMVQGRWNLGRVGGTDFGRNGGITLSFKWPCITICSPSPGFSDLHAALQARRKRGDWGGALSPPVFGRSIHPISTRVGTLSPPITTSPPGFSDLATALSHRQTQCFFSSWNLLLKIVLYSRKNCTVVGSVAPSALVKMS